MTVSYVGSQVTVPTPAPQDNSANAANTSWTTQFVATAYTYVTANTLAIVGHCYSADTTSGGFTLTLPAGPLPGQFVTVSNSMGTFAANALSIDPGSNNIDGQAGILICNVNTVSFTLFYANASVGWNLVF